MPQQEMPPAETNGSDENEDPEYEDMPSRNYLVHEHLRRMPTVISRGLLYLIVAIIAIAVIYGYLAEVDIVVESQAVARSTSPQLNVKSDRSGYVDKVFVEEGDLVKEGDPLFLIRSKKTIDYRSQIETLKEKIPLKRNLYGSKIEAKRNRLEEIQVERVSTLRVKRLKIDQNKSTLKSLKSDLEYWKDRKRSIKDEFEKTKSLYEQQLTSIREFNRVKNQLEKARNQIENLKTKIKNRKNENAILREEMKKARQRFDQNVSDLEQQIENLQIERQSELETLRNELESTRSLMSLNDRDTSTMSLSKLDENVIRAAKPGIITGIQVRNSGRYLAKGQRLCTIVPEGSKLYMEVNVRNKDIGFIEDDMRVKYKFDAFPYRDYGMREGRVTWVSPSAIEAKQGMVYRVEGTLNKNYYQVDGERYPIKPGMTATAELVTERKSIIRMLFSKIKS